MSGDDGGDAGTGPGRFKRSILLASLAAIAAIAVVIARRSRRP